MFTATVCAITGALPAARVFEAAEAAKGSSFWEKLGGNIWYIVLVLAFGAGLIIINRWQAKIRARDEKFKKEYDAWKEEHPEEADALENGEYSEGVPAKTESPVNDGTIEEDLQSADSLESGNDEEEK